MPRIQIEFFFFFSLLNLLPLHSPLLLLRRELDHQYTILRHGPWEQVPNEKYCAATVPSTSCYRQTKLQNRIRMRPGVSLTHKPGLTQKTTAPKSTNELPELPANLDQSGRGPSDQSGRSSTLQDKTLQTNQDEALFFFSFSLLAL